MAIEPQGLKHLRLFKDLPAEALARIAPELHLRRFARGQTIILAGERCQAVHFIATGVVRMVRSSPDGREQVLAYAGHGEAFDLVAALDGQPYLATVDALTDATLYTISCDRLRRIVLEHQEVTLALVRGMAAELRRLTDMVEALALHTVRTRLAKFLLAQMNGELPPRRWTQEEIAAQIGTVREMVGRTLRDLDSDGLIRRQRGRIVIVDEDSLATEAAGD